jgi:hypothetical protein
MHPVVHTTGKQKIEENVVAYCLHLTAVSVIIVLTVDSNPVSKLVEHSTTNLKNYWAG